MNHRFVGDHIEEVADGVTAEPGAFVDLSEEQLDEAYTKELLESGRLIPGEPEPDTTEAAEKLAKKHKIEITSVAGTGQGGRVTVEDVQRTIDEQKGKEG